MSREAGIGGIRVPRLRQAWGTAGTAVARHARLNT